MKSLFAKLQSIPYEENHSVAKPQILRFAMVKNRQTILASSFIQNQV